MPHGEPRNWKLLASYVNGTEKKQASGVVEALASATYHAPKMGRDRAEFSDIEWGLAHVHDQPRTTSANSQKIGCRGPNSRGNSSFSQPDERNGSRINAPLAGKYTREKLHEFWRFATGTKMLWFQALEL